MADSSAESPLRTGSTASLQFRPMARTESDLQLFRECFAINDSPRSIELFRWQYFETPVKRLYVDFAISSDAPQQLAAIYGVFPVMMRIDGDRRLGVQSLDTLTAAAFRGKGLFTRMAAAVYERCASDGASLVYGFPNANSAHGIFKRLNWNALDPMPVMLKPMRIGYVLSRLVKSARKLPAWMNIKLHWKSAPRNRDFQAVDELGPEFTEVWKSFSRDIPFGVERDAEYLNWRLRRPGEQYELVALRDQSKLVGYVITGIQRATTPGAARTGKIMDLICDPGYSDAAEVLLREGLHRLLNAE